MALRIPKRGEFSIQHADGTTSTVWYNRDIKLWTHQLLDAAGNQVGPGPDATADYAHNRSTLVADVLRLHADIMDGPDMTFDCASCFKQKSLDKLGQTNCGPEGHDLICTTCVEKERTAGHPYSNYLP